MFGNVLIANRGEIAVRIIRACRELGITTTCVYSELDRNAMHVRLADQAFALGGRTVAESYLDTEAILDIAERSGVDAVHPGYGFYSENADFARAVGDLGITFIGPGPEAIEVMGDKISARRAAEKVGVDAVPGDTTTVVDADQIAVFGEQHGWPVAVKAAYGGGGRGMRIVSDASAAVEGLAAARREAQAFFGRSECYLERYLTRPRHVEVQILADSHGNCIHLGTRDCSAQRRHQKLIEEAPAPDIPAAVAQAMGEAAVAVAKGCDYANAGTVEFLYEAGTAAADADDLGGFYYLEMNTRLQVEHPVTELVTGIDLVEQQLRIAAGEPLTLRQDDIELKGHAIEVRINAEDPAEGAFLPSPGTIRTLRAPDGFGTRFDTGYESGDEISQYYDNLVGKLIVWGRNRERSIARAVRALSELEIRGIATTVDADLAILTHPDFAAVAHSTKWVENSLDLSGVGAVPVGTGPDDPAEPHTRRSLDVEVNGKLFSVSMWVPDAPSAGPAPGGNAPRTRRTGSRSAGPGGSGEVTVGMQGTIVKVNVAVGSEVAEGDVVVVLEAMKMENHVLAERAGTVTEVRVCEGDSVGGGDVVAVIG